MGGLALGAWLAARYTRRIRHPLLAYAAIEAAIGVLGLLFHGGFTRAVEFHYQHLLPLATDPLAATTIKGLLALLLIGPQTVLVGATFPLMTAGVLRALPQSSGSKIALLYFSNSIGAAAGVLASAFILIPWSGLPGTILSGGLINIAVALAVWLIVRRGGMQPAVGAGIEAGAAAGGLHRLAPWMLLATAAFTGTASFVYEVVWIRMLSLVLGASTHSFELMLSAFITGLSLGSLAMRRHIDRIAQPYRALAYIQILMGLFALGSLWVYSESFHWMAALMSGINRTEQGYTLFLAASHAICFVIMLPATFMAGMTLPLITHGLLRDGYGERAVGAVYSVNTLGSIAGVVFALHIAIPLTGLKASLIIGGGIDILIGVALLALTAVGLAAKRPAAAVIVAVAGVMTASWGITLDPYKLNSGVYRYGQASLPKNTQFFFYQDGKTASISLYRMSDEGRVLVTNGKPEGRINAFASPPSGDDVTTTLLAGLGMAFHPEARSAANIGLGTGVTTRTLLRNPRLEQVDTIEIEEKVIAAVQLLRDEVDAVFTDRRSRIVVDDAKSFFAARRARYDIIVAEPSNPWVSGVASLFTTEFYRRMLDYLTERGIFVQWLQAYEIDLESVASVMLALGSAFPNYTVYSTNGVDLLVVAWKDGSVREPHAGVLDWPELKADWRRIGVDGMQDVEARRIGGKAVLHPLFRSYTVPENSDYFPYLDDRAVRARFLRRGADDLNILRTSALPLVEMLEERERPYHETRVAQTTFVHRALAMRDAVAAHRFLRGERLPEGLLRGTRIDLAVMSSYCDNKNLIDDREALNAFIGVAISILPYLTQEESRQALSPLLQGKCLARLGEAGRLVGELSERIIERDGAGMRAGGEQLLAQLPQDADRRLLGFALDSAMLGTIVNGDPAHAQTLWQRHGKRVQTGRTIPIENRLMLSVAEVRMKQR
ncbi:MAG: spermidine synthase [Betaproteobacteria bacterium]|nr:spermidine synthase [Betaproteobacteria bacterium]